MNIQNEESFSEQYAIISYSHADTDAVKSELKLFDDNGVCYWFDERMTGGKSYETQFFDILDNKNCKGIIFFISDSFLLSDPCAKEMEYFKNKYGIDNQEKFSLFVLQKDYPFKDGREIYVKVDKFVNDSKDEGIREKLYDLKEHIGLFLELNKNGKDIFATIGNVNNYIGAYCEEGLFNNAGIIFGHKQVNNEMFGYFPQKQKRTGASEIEKDTEERNADKEKAYYAKLEWIVIKDNEKSQALLSKDLLFTVDYLSLKYPFKQTGKTPADVISGYFLNYIKPEDDRRKIKTVRFLSEKEFQGLLVKCGRDMVKKRALLLPEPTFFAQITNSKDVPSFWLAGDMNDARRVDPATESLCGEKAGVELYYVRIVIEVEK